MADYRYKPNGSEFAMDLYGLLQVSQQASPEVIKAAHRVLYQNFGPKKSGDDETMGKNLNVARDILLDKDMRPEYDAHRQAKADGTIGHYDIVKHIAEGGHCDVYLGKHQLNHSPAVLKHCRSLGYDDQMILIEESATLSGIQHFAIPKFRDIYRLEDGSLLLVEDYIPGPTLQELVTACGKLHPETACWIAARVLQILHYLHFNGVVHGDIKPENLILQPDEHQVFLVDFGLAMVKPATKDKNKGSVEIFSPPEQRSSSRPRLLPQNDLYSLGMTMIFMLTADMAATKAKQIQKSTHSAVRQFIARLTKEDSKDRPYWGAEDLEKTLMDVRQEAFGRVRSGFASIPDWKQKLHYDDVAA